MSVDAKAREKEGLHSSWWCIRCARAARRCTGTAKQGKTRLTKNEQQKARGTMPVSADSTAASVWGVSSENR